MRIFENDLTLKYCNRIEFYFHKEVIEFPEIVNKAKMCHYFTTKPNETFVLTAIHTG